MDDQPQHHHHQPGTTGQPSGSGVVGGGSGGGGGDDVRPTQVFANSPYAQAYPVPGSHHPSASPSLAHMAGHQHAQGPSAIPARRTARDDDPDDLFPEMPEAKKRKFILVEDNVRGSRLRVRVTLEGVDTREIPDSFRKGASVYPRSYFPREMQSPPPSATGSRFFLEDLSDSGRNTDAEDDGIEDTEGRAASRRGAARSSTTTAARRKTVVPVLVGESEEGEVTIPRMRRAMRGKEVRLNDLGYRMAWLQSRVFAGRTVFLQRARESWLIRLLTYTWVFSLGQPC
jgi:hypothetical protein